MQDASRRPQPGSRGGGDGHRACALASCVTQREGGDPHTPGGSQSWIVGVCLKHIPGTRGRRGQVIQGS